MKLVKSLAQHLTQELADQIQHMKDLMEIDTRLEVIDREMVIFEFRKVINEHLTERKSLFERDALWYGKID